MIYNRYSPFFFFFFVAALFGEESPILDSSSLTFGGGFSYLKTSQSSGTLGSFQTSYIYQPESKFYLEFKLNMNRGPIYDCKRKKWILDIDTQERIGYSFKSMTQKWIVTLFSGLGYRYINQKEEWFDISFSSSCNDLYVPLGVRAEMVFLSRLSIGILGEWKPQVYPTMTVSSRNEIIWRTEKTLRNFTLEVPIKINLYQNSQIYLALNPLIDFWQEGQTLRDFCFGLPIPKQNFLSIGINMNFIIRF